MPGFSYHALPEPEVDRFDIGDLRVEIRRQASNRRRPARAHEIFRDHARGRLPSPFRENLEIEWRVVEVTRRRLLGIIRQRADGAFHAGRIADRDIRKVACFLAGRSPDEIQDPTSGPSNRPAP